MCFCLLSIATAFADEIGQIEEMDSSYWGLPKFSIFVCPTKLRDSELLVHRSNRRSFFIVDANMNELLLGKYFMLWM